MRLTSSQTLRRPKASFLATVFARADVTTLRARAFSAALCTGRRLAFKSARSIARRDNHRERVTPIERPRCIRTCMIYMVVALECPSALRKFIPLCEARRHENAARLQCWEGAALEIHRKCESSRAPRMNLTPHGARSRSERITRGTVRLRESPKRFAHLRFRRRRPESIEEALFDRTSKAVCAFSVSSDWARKLPVRFFSGSLRRFADFRVRRTGPEISVWQKSYAVWQLSGRPVKFSGRLMTEPESCQTA